MVTHKIKTRHRDNYVKTYANKYLLENIMVSVLQTILNLKE
jgi:hypothetical protein